MEQAVKQSTGIAHRYLSSGSRIPIAIFYTFVCVVLVMGWQANLENYISAESGVGYFLGIAGGTMMLIMLLYSLRKRVHSLRNLFPTKYWFRMHMMLGVLGPTFILFHCAFSLGSTNSNVALFCMLTVASSGLIGRYLYSQIHYGLYGRKATAKQMQEDFVCSSQEIEALYRHHPDIEGRLFRTDMSDIDKKRDVISQFLYLLFYAVKSRIEFYSALKMLLKAKSALAAQEGWDKKTTRKFYLDTRKVLVIYYATIRKIVGFQFYERMFALWHVLHIPLFIMMIISGVAHVFAVHLY
jgi:hypothetical protein